MAKGFLYWEKRLHRDGNGMTQCINPDLLSNVWLGGCRSVFVSMAAKVCAFRPAGYLFCRSLGQSKVRCLF